MRNSIFVGILCATFNVLAAVLPAAAAEPVKIGFNYPKTGPYAAEGLDQLRGAEMAVDDINSTGGILGRKIELLVRDSKSDPKVSEQNALELVVNGATMIFGGASSGVAVAVGKVAHQHNILFFGTLTYSMDTTGKDGYKTTFRECYDSWMASQALGEYLLPKFQNKKYFYLTANYTWGWTTEAALRVTTDTMDSLIHKGRKVPFPGATEADFRAALIEAKRQAPGVLVLVLFGDDFSTAIKIANELDLGRGNGVQIVVPNVTLAMAERAGAAAMEGVIGATPWEWNIANEYPEGKLFVERFALRYNRYPSTSAASAYTILNEYKSAVQRVGTFDTGSVTIALEGHKYMSMKDVQTWREFDHQSVQSVFLVEGVPERDVLADPFKLNYFKTVSRAAGENVVIPQVLWNWQRLMNGKAAELD
jgi:branched-chain amino acid transport system substrate-binding protein